MPPLFPPSIPTPATLFSHLATFSTATATRGPPWNSTSPNLRITNPLLLTLETSCASFSHLKQIQAQFTLSGLISHVFPLSRLLAFSALSPTPNMSHALLLFSLSPHPNTFFWNTVIRGYTHSRSPFLALSFLRRMLLHSPSLVDPRTFVFSLKVSLLLPHPSPAESLHSLILKFGFHHSLLVQNTLIHLYLKFALLEHARKAFVECPLRDVVTWTTMIDGCAQLNLPDEALRLFWSMVSTSSVAPNAITVIATLSACSRVGLPSVGRKVHEFIKRNELVRGLNVLNALVDMYAKCGCLDIAREVFDGMEVRDVFTWTSMVNGYAKCRDLEVARKLFDEMPDRNVVSWNAMIAGYSQANRPKEALDLFCEMRTRNVRPTEETLVSTFSACAQSGCLELGRWIDEYYVNGEKVESTVILTNARIDMYGKCGNIDIAMEIFESMPEKGLVSWNSMIAACAVHGYGEKALALFERMKGEGIVPDAITFVGALSACSHSGLVAEGRECFESMRAFGLVPKLEHYACMIDLLGRVGNLEDIFDLIRKMPIEPDEAGWGALLNACRMHGNVDLGKKAAEKLLHMDPGDSGIYALLANMFATKNRWNDVKVVRRMMRERGIKKTPGCSSIEVDGKFHEFLVADNSHPISADIYSILDQLSFQLMLRGYIPSKSELVG